MKFLSSNFLALIVVVTFCLLKRSESPETELTYVTTVLTGSFQFILHCEEMSLPNTTLCAKCPVILAL